MWRLETFATQCNEKKTPDNTESLKLTDYEATSHGYPQHHSKLHTRRGFEQALSTSKKKTQTKSLDIRSDFMKKERNEDFVFRIFA